MDPLIQWLMEEISKIKVVTLWDTLYIFAYNSAGNLKSYFAGFLRYGNPEMQILGTLKIKLQFYKFLVMPSKNIGSDFIFRVAIYL